MVVSIDKATALKMHDKVRKYWAQDRERVEKELAAATKYGAKADPDKAQAVFENGTKAITKAIAEAHAGQISCRSTPEGTTFRVELPL